MGNNFKRFLAFVLAFAMVFAYVPANAFAAEADETTYVAKIGETKYASVMDALLAAAEIESSETVKVELLADSREVMTKDTELLIKSNVELVSATGDPVVAKFYNNGTNYDFVFNSATGFDGKTFTIGKDVTFYLEDRTIWAGYYGNNVDIIVNGILWAGYQYWNGADTIVTATGTLKSAGEALVLRRGATLKADGGKIEASYFSMLSGNLVAENGATVTCGPVWINNAGNYVNEGNVTITVKGSTLTSNSNLKSDSVHADGVTIVIENSQVEFQEKNHGGSVLDDNTTLNVIGEEAKLSMKNVTNAGTIRVSGGAQVVTETVDNAGSVIVESGSSFVDQDGALKLPVAKIGTEYFETLAAALAAAKDGDEIVLLADATPALTSQRAITKAAVIDLGGKTLTLTEDDLYFGTTTFKNGTIVVDPSVKPSTAVFWMFANQTLTFDNVKVVATGVTGTYLIGLEGTNSNLNLLNGSEILIENTTALDLDVICVNGSSDNKIVIADSKVNVTNLDGRVLFRGNYTIKGNSQLNLDGITKAGIRIEAGQTLAIEDTAKVVITGEPRDGGIHLTDATATYTKAATATVNATVNAPAPAAVAKIGEQGYETLEAALAAACADPSITRIEILSDYVQTSVENTEDYYNIAQNLVIDASQKVTISGCGFAVRVMAEGASLTIEENVTIEGLDIVANGFGTTGENMTINGTMKAKSLKQWTNDGTITVAETGKVVLGYGDGQFDMAYGNGTVTINGSGDKTAAQFKAGYSGTRGNGNTLNLNNTYFEGGAWFKIEGSNGTFNVNNSILKVSGGDAAGLMTIRGSDNVIKLTNGAKLVVDSLTIGEGNTLVVGDNCTLEVKTLTNNGIIQVVGKNATLNIEKLSGEEITLMDGAIVKDSTIGGSVFVAGKVIFRGANTVNMLYDYGTLTDYYGTTANMEWTVEAGSSLTFTDKARYGLGYGDQVTIYGSLIDALNARETLTEDDISFFTHGLVAQESKDWNCKSSLTVENAYVVIGSNNSFGNKPGNYGGTYTFNFSNAVLDASRITFYKALSTAEFNFTNTDAKVGTFMTRDPDSVFTLTNTKLVSTTTTNGNDEGNYHAGTLVLNNSSLTYSAPLVMENGTLTVGAGSSLTAPSITGTGKIIIDATDMTAGEVTAINADASGFTGTLSVINNDKLEAEIVDGKIVLSVKPVAMIGETEYESLAEAIKAANAGDIITLLADVEASEVILIDKSLTINGNGHKVTSNATRVFRVTTADVDVTLNDVNMVSNAVRIGTNDIRGISVDDVTGVELTLNNCSVDFTDASANDWTYAVNVVGGSNHTVTVNGGTYEGANVINVRGANNTVTVKDATLNCLYPNNDMYFGACIWVQQNQNSSVDATGNIFNGDNALAFNLGTGNTLTESNNTDNTKIVVAKVNGSYYHSLAEAFEAAQDGDTIKVLQNIEQAEMITNTKNVTLDLNGKTISGTCAGSQTYLFMVNNGATLTIEDSSAEQTGKITFAGNNSTGWIVDVEGALVLESGTLELTGTWNIGYAVDVRPNAWGTAYTAPTTFEMNGGKIVSSDGAVRVASSSSHTYDNISASFTMNSGEIDAAWDGVFVQQSDAAWDVLNVTINGGTIKAALNPIRFYGPAATSYVNGEDCVDIKLNGGTLTYTGTETREWLIEGILRLGGGVNAAEFLKDSAVTASQSFAEANVADGFKWVEAENGKYELVECDYVAEVNGKNYESLQAAIDAAGDGATVTLLADINVGTGCALIRGKKITIDLNGHNITGTGYRVLFVDLLASQNKDGKLTLVGNGTVENTGTTSGSSYAVYVGGNSELVVEAGATVKSANGYAVFMAPMGAGRVSKLAVNGGTVTGRYAVSGSGQLTDTSTVITVNSGTVIGTEVGIYQPQPGTVTVNGGTVSGGQAALAMRRGTASITGGTIVGLIDVVGDYEATNVAITGGDFTNATLQYADGDGNVVTKADAVQLAAPADYKWVNGVLTACEYVAEVNGVKFESLADAIAAAGNGDTVTLLADSDEDVTVVQAPDVKITIDGNGKTMTGSITVNGKSAAYATAGLTIQNVNFVQDTASQVFINLGGNNTIRYTSNVTVDNCIFKGNDNTAVGIKNYTGGCKNLTVTNCTATGMHSLVQVKGVAGLKISDVNITEGKNGIAVGTSTNVVIENATITATGYGVRADGTGAYNMTVKDSTISANQPVVIRKAAGDYQLTVTGSTLASSNDKGYGVIFTNRDDGEALVFPEGDFELTLSETNTKVYPCLEGDGTEANPYKISSLDDLILFRDSVNAGKTKYNAEGVYVALTADIKMSGVNWNVNIGDGANVSFDGIFDGKNHYISNMTITETAQTSDGYICTGLFGCIGGNAVIKNLNFDNAQINTGNYTGTNAGVVVGFAWSANGSIENVHVLSSTINANKVDGVGAIVGYAYGGNLKITDCSVTNMSINGQAYVGGVVGYGGGKMVITNTKIYTIAVNANSCAAGGIAGILLDGGEINTATVEDVRALTSAHVNWQNAKAIAVGCTTGTITVANVTAKDVNVTAMVGAVHADKPTTPVVQVPARVGNVYYTTLEAAVAAANGEEVALLCDSAVDLVITAPVVLNLNNNAYTGKVTLSDTAATLTAAEGLTVTTNVDGYEVKYVDGKYQLVEEKEEIERFDLYGANMDLGNKLDMNFYFLKSYITDAESYAVITKEYADGSVVTKTIDACDFVSQSKDLYKITFEGIAAKEMADTITVTIYDSNGNQISNVWTDSVRDYSIRMLAKATTDVERALFVDMLNYGTAAQKEFHYNEDDFANNQLTAEQQELATKLDSLENNSNFDKSYYYGANMDLESNIKFNMYFLRSKVTSDMSMEISYVDHNGNAHSIVVNGSDFIVQSKDLYKVTVEGLVVADVEQMITCVIKDADGNEVTTVIESIESYLARKSSSSELYNAIMKFGLSANAYLHRNDNK